ncbi:hypothetical protein IQ268_09055 [Oculatella sp. LEGE 06141]|uniref:hypothetical protein n=1 Tax=Oculatella sp. LEGE 06141 TaxID=1828648 RepID=UPI00188003A9|nr:hypothetical protein [Oculatella sp. LEGE 06141]MBE9178707.1 hypothetical protein [Oculatella sp. LEGE 06141]
MRQAESVPVDYEIPLGESKPVRRETQPIANPKAVAALNVSRHLQRHWRSYAVGAGFSVLMLVYTSQWQKQQSPRQLDNPTDARVIPAYNESQLIVEQMGALEQRERNLSAFLHEERQRTLIALAQAYRALATMYISSGGHPCNGRTVLECLRTFEPNRIAELRSLSSRNWSAVDANPNNVLLPLLTKAAEADKVEGLRLAVILEIPSTSRPQWMQDELDLRYPLLASGIPPEEMQPRPETLANLLGGVRDQRQQILNGSQEKSARTERCLSMPEEERVLDPGCLQ